MDKDKRWVVEVGYPDGVMVVGRYSTWSWAMMGVDVLYKCGEVLGRPRVRKVR